jgi:uncharacterized protein DUF4238
MSDRANQHFVPQFYFKHFSRGTGFIHLLLQAADRIILNASVKGQCARHKFYGAKELEKAFSKLEERHAEALHTLLSIAWSLNPPQMTPELLAWLWEAVLFQRGRTALEIEKRWPAMEAQGLELFKQYLTYAPGVEDRDQLVQQIEKGNVRIDQPPQVTVLLSIEAALESVLLISDMDIHVLRNHTDYPFIFSDAPVIFYNTYLRNVTNQGVLGLQAPGLQIFMPLDSSTLLMLSDGTVYSGPYKRSVVYDVLNKSDVSQLNALQLHHSLNAVYFADEKAAGYVSDLWHAHKQSIVPPRAAFRVREDLLIDGEPADGPVYHTYEPQLNYPLSLSFVDCSPLQESEYRFSYRNRELVEEHRRLDLCPELAS